MYFSVLPAGGDLRRQSGQVALVPEVAVEKRKSRHQHFPVGPAAGLAVNNHEINAALLNREL